MGDEKLKAEARKKKFEESPNKFIDLDDVIMVAYRTTHDGRKGVVYGIGQANVDEIGMVNSRLNYETMRVYQQAEIQKQKMSKAGGIITPDNGKSRF